MWGRGPRLINQNLPGRSLTGVEKHCSKAFRIFRLFLKGPKAGLIDKNRSCLILLVTSSLVIRAYLLLETEKCKSEGFVAEACIVSSVLVGSSQRLTFHHHGVLCTAQGQASEQTEVSGAKTAYLQEMRL